MQSAQAKAERRREARIAALKAELASTRCEDRDAVIAALDAAGVRVGASGASKRKAQSTAQSHAEKRG